MGVMGKMGLMGLMNSRRKLSFSRPLTWEGDGGGVPFSLPYLEEGTGVGSFQPPLLWEGDGVGFPFTSL